ncbi:MAG: glycoside hydrolase, partial [Caldilineaceae bacterium]
FSSRQVNVGLDEPIDVGMGASLAAVQERGLGPVFLDYLLQVLASVKRRGRPAQVWGDIIREHPELTAQLPRDMVALEWGYEADHPFDVNGARYAASGVPFYLCPGTSSWNSVAGRTDNALENVRNAARNGRKHGAVGLLMTDWGDNGHWQPPSVSLLPLAFGLAAAWNVEATCADGAEEILTATASQHLLQDESGVAAPVALALGRLEGLLPTRLHNSHALFHLLQHPFGGEGDGVLERTSGEEWRHALAAVRVEIDTQLALLEGADPQAPIARAMVRELRWAAAMLNHAAERGLWLMDGKPATRAALLADDAQALLDEYTELWALSSRPGGFAESVAPLRTLVASYAD